MPLNPRQRNMQLIRELPHTANRPSAVAIGNFDGLHLGHQAVITAMKTAAAEKKLTPSVLTFAPHPRRFFSKDTAPFQLMRISEKLRGLNALGVEQIFAPRFNNAFAGLSAEEFLERVLYQQLGARAVIIGENFVFGHKRSGNITLMKEWGTNHGVTIITVPSVVNKGVVCSSSTVRQAVFNGDMQAAAELLGRPYTITGRVVHGDGRGRQLGYPTANIALTPGLLLPQTGVYVVEITVSGAKYQGVANLGYRPTLGVDFAPKFEVHLFDTLQDLYEKRLTVSLVHKLRDEKKFDTMENLMNQITADAAAARRYFGAAA